MATPVGYTQVNPHTSTRSAFTSNLLSVTAPSTSASQWRTTCEHNQALLRALFSHPAMEPNREQTFMTPANRKSKVYFLWDFVGRTLGFLYNVPPTLKSKDGGDMHEVLKEMWQDCLGRTQMAAMLVLDKDSQMGRMMFREPGDSTLEWGDEVVRAARAIAE